MNGNISSNVYNLLDYKFINLKLTFINKRYVIITYHFFHSFFATVKYLAHQIAYDKEKSTLFYYDY